MSLPLLPEACIAGLRADDAKDALAQLSARLLAAGAVTETFPAALWQREQEYPTGLPLPVPCVIAHTDPQHVKRDCLALTTLAQPVAFQQMGSPEITLAVRLVLVLAVRDGAGQAERLSHLLRALSGDTSPLLQAVKDEELYSLGSRLL
ncbi:PTS sugar transporter subunit IIA [Dermabacteraceae bacterium TAE3-ERU5]|nr:PTS sugar transporter subunit IIA [Dermabacteraceae bacterium TAE3-ERU5]